MNHKTTFSKNLKYYMEQKGISQKELAEIVGVSAPAFNDWVMAKKYPRIDKIELLANYFGCPMSELIEDNQSAENELSIEAKERASRIYKLIVESGKSYKELETITGVTKSCLQRYATGERNIPIIAIEKLATTFNVSKSYLMWGEEKQSATMGMGNKIRTARTEKGMSQEELGNLIGVQKSTIAKYENGRVVNIKINTLKKISNILGIKPSELICEECDNTFYQRYVELCNKIGKTPSAVALDIGLTKSSVHRWKNGGKPTDATAIKIASYFNVSVAYLIGTEEEKQSGYIELSEIQKNFMQKVARMSDEQIVKIEHFLALLD